MSGDPSELAPAQLDVLECGQTPDETGHYKLQQYISMRFASTLVVLPNLIVQGWHC